MTFVTPHTRRMYWIHGLRVVLQYVRTDKYRLQSPTGENTRSVGFSGRSTAENEIELAGRPAMWRARPPFELEAHALITRRVL